MGSNAVFFAWNRSIPGREQVSAQHFKDFVQFLTESQKKGSITSFDVMFLNNHGGDMNGFFLIRGENDALNALVDSDEWLTHMTRGGHHLEGSGAVRGAAGELVMEWMNRWGSIIAG